METRVAEISYSADGGNEWGLFSRGADRAVVLPVDAAEAEWHAPGAVAVVRSWFVYRDGSEAAHFVYEVDVDGRVLSESRGRAVAAKGRDVFAAAVAARIVEWLAAEDQDHDDVGCDAEVRYVADNHGYPFQVVCESCDAMSQTLGSRRIAEDVLARHLAYPNGKLIAAVGDPGDFMHRPARVEFALPWRASTGDRIVVSA